MRATKSSGTTSDRLLTVPRDGCTFSQGYLFGVMVDGGFCFRSEVIQRRNVLFFLPFPACRFSFLLLCSLTMSFSLFSIILLLVEMEEMRATIEHASRNARSSINPLQCSVAPTFFPSRAFILAMKKHNHLQTRKLIQGEPVIHHVSMDTILLSESIVHFDSYMYYIPNQQTRRFPPFSCLEPLFSQ